MTSLIPSAAPVLLAAADSGLVADLRPSPNHGERRGPFATHGPDLVVLHYTGMPAGRGLSAAERAIRWLTDPVSEVSAHYVVAEDGAITQLVAESRRAWHAGRASWHGESDVNSASIGIEIVNPGHWWDLAVTPDRDPGAPVEVHPGWIDYPEAQIAAVIALVGDIVARRGFDSRRVVGHSDVAPGRKRDPGERFPWGRLAAAGLGAAIDPVPIDGTTTPRLELGDASPPVAALQRLLAIAGYGIVVDGVFGEATRAVVEALQRHFRPERVDGRADRSTFETLRALVDRGGSPGGRT
ncbi:N-acetylmuramoyl-L-alanine amidase [Siculibacillus lacustris]|uniref:N-acetylmuramoyl-L-alanine amidase n=1 Tax=Siculibacillus lacustris TaxID=1549641 RepID=A0A4Q9VT37_9HYPH|nr:N-acetylmuramoyl-L-alanine amidase [Siculibacillus lacustris]TBW38719.1 N-acetylmuramoyl-L-alanine amidase [Siculibacillus lacustris]